MRRIGYAEIGKAVVQVEFNRPKQAVEDEEQDDREGDLDEEEV